MPALFCCLQPSVAFLDYLYAFSLPPCYHKNVLRVVMKKSRHARWLPGFFFCPLFLSLITPPQSVAILLLPVWPKP
jgi:hypothetical protein